jgi:hypothetical protein
MGEWRGRGRAATPASEGGRASIVCMRVVDATFAPAVDESRRKPAQGRGERRRGSRGVLTTRSARGFPSSPRLARAQLSASLGAAPPVSLERGVRARSLPSSAPRRGGWAFLGDRIKCEGIPLHTTTKRERLARVRSIGSPSGTKVRTALGSSPPLECPRRTRTWREHEGSSRMTGGPSRTRTVRHELAERGEPRSTRSRSTRAPRPGSSAARIGNRLIEPILVERGGADALRRGKRARDHRGTVRGRRRRRRACIVVQRRSRADVCR